MRKKESGASATRAAIYVRVSGEEQKLHGLSLESQQERLEQYAREKGWIITGVYVDAAKTARKSIGKRTEFWRMIESVKRDEVDILLFTRLDRWFRSVADYYKVIEILEAHSCEWLTTDEEYDTTTANGRLYINVKLSIAQNEADITSERIAVVFDTKISHGTVISGHCPFGYRVNDDKRLEIIPDQAEIIRDVFDRYENGASKWGTIKYVRETYGVNWCYDTFSRILTNELYTGVYNHSGRRNENFAPPILDRAQFDRVQDLLSRNVYHGSKGYVYIFTSLVTCDECGKRMVGHHVKNQSGTEFYYYKCKNAFERARCSHRKLCPEKYIETWLFEHIGVELDKVEAEYQIAAKHRRDAATTQEKAALKGKLTRLKELYVNDLIDIDEYKHDYEIYSAALSKMKAPKKEKSPDFSAVRRMLEKDYRAIYGDLSKEEKRTLWRSVIKEIRVNSSNEIVGISFA